MRSERWQLRARGVEHAVEPQHAVAACAGAARRHPRHRRCARVVDLVDPAVLAAVAIAADAIHEQLGGAARAAAARSGRSRARATPMRCRSSARDAARPAEWRPTPCTRAPTPEPPSRAPARSSPPPPARSSPPPSPARARPAASAGGGAPRLAGHHLELDPVLARHELLVAVAAAVERLHVEHVTARRQARAAAGTTSCGSIRSRRRTPSCNACRRTARAARSTTGSCARARAGAARASPRARRSGRRRPRPSAAAARAGSVRPLRGPLMRATGAAESLTAPPGPTAWARAARAARRRLRRRLDTQTSQRVRADRRRRARPSACWSPRCRTAHRSRPSGPSARPRHARDGRALERLARRCRPSRSPRPACPRRRRAGPVELQQRR